MKILYWNCRGFGNYSTKPIFKNFCLSNKSGFAFLSEPWIDISLVSDSYWRQLNLKVFCLNDRNDHICNLWGLCNIYLNHVVLSVTSQQCSFSICSDTQVTFMSAVYASTNYQLRRQLWSDLNDLQMNSPSPWCIVSDFNCVLGSHKVRSSSFPLRVACDEFRAFTDTGKWIHLQTTDASFTWSNGRKGSSLTEKRLDRSLCNEAWLDYWSSSVCCTLVRSQPDHFPLLLSSNKSVQSFP